MWGVWEKSGSESERGAWKRKVITRKVASYSSNSSAFSGWCARKKEERENKCRSLSVFCVCLSVSSLLLFCWHIIKYSTPYYDDHNEPVIAFKDTLSCTQSFAWIFYLNEFNYLSYYYLWLNKHHNTHTLAMQAKHEKFMRISIHRRRKSTKTHSGHWIHFHETYELYARARELYVLWMSVGGLFTSFWFHIERT